MQLQAALLDNQGYNFLLTGRLTQDCIENLFSVVRMKKPEPSAYNFKCTLRLVCISQFIHRPKNSSYRADDGEYLIDFFSAQSQLTAAEDASDELEGNLLELLTTEQCDILASMAGFLLKAVLKTVGCMTSMTALTGTLNDEHSKLIKLKGVHK